MSNTIAIRSKIQAAILLLMVLTAYFPSIHHSFIWDDDYYITHNTTLSGFSGLRDIWVKPGATPQYYPLVFTSFWVEYHLFGLNPAIFHATNILLHAANIILIWLLLRSLGVPWPWLVAALFALHPVNVESVAWVSERKNVLSSLFVLLSLRLLTGACPLHPTENIHLSPPRHTRARYSAAFLFFVLALLSKTVTCVMPVVFLLLAWWKSPGTWLKKIPATLPFFLAGGLAGLHTAFIEKTHVGAYGAEWGFSIIDRILIAGRALWFYAYKLIWPANLVFIYPRWEINATVWWQYLFPTAFLAVLILTWTGRNRFGRGAFTGTAIFAVALFPALGFINYYPMRFSFVADHFQYMAGTALIAMITAGAHRLFHNNRPRAGQALYIFCAGLLLLLGVRVWQEQAKYRDLKALWKDTLIKNPACWMAHNNMGVLQEKAGAPGKAAMHYMEALRLYPTYAEAHRNLARVKNQGNLNALDRPYRESLHLKSHTGDVYISLGNFMTLFGNFSRAERCYRKAIALTPKNPDAWYHIGSLYEQRGDPDEAIRHYRQALRLDPLSTESLKKLGALYIERGKDEEAIKYLSILIAIDPFQASAYRSLGAAYAALGQKEKAASAYYKALTIQPYHTKTQTTLRVLLEEGPTAETPER